MEDEKIKVRLCKDHFQRVLDGSVCNTCPSKAENEAVVLALSKMESGGEDQVRETVIRELSSMRRALTKVGTDVEGLAHALHGSPEHAGIMTKIAVNQKALSSLDKRTSTLETRMWAAVIAGLLGAGSALWGFITKPL